MRDAAEIAEEFDDQQFSVIYMELEQQIGFKPEPIDLGKDVIKGFVKLSEDVVYANPLENLELLELEMDNKLYIIKN